VSPFVTYLLAENDGGSRGESSGLSWAEDQCTVLTVDEVILTVGKYCKYVRSLRAPYHYLST
jgi:hypothetical protein